MYKRMEKIVFSTVFLIGLFLPMIFMNHKPNVESETENRMLASPAKLYLDDGTYNTNFTNDFETWFNDNIGFRSLLAEADGRIQYDIFRLIKDMPLGIHGELAPYKDLNDYQHKDLYDEEKVQRITHNYDSIDRYLRSQGIQMYYMECWDKHSIYPEIYPDTITVYGDVSRSDQIEQSLVNNTDIRVVQLKDVLLKAKESAVIYSPWYDPWHWNKRGSLIGYQELMRTINRYNDQKYPILEEEDFDITIEDRGKTFYNSIHQEDMVEIFTVKNKTWLSKREKLTYQPQDIMTTHMEYFENNAVNNDDTLLILGDSYIHDSAILSCLAATFHTTVMYNYAALENDRLTGLIETYKPDIVLFETAERASDKHFRMTAETLDAMRTRTYRPGTPIRFRDVPAASPYILNGIRLAEDSSWTTGKESTLFLAPDIAPGTPLRMSLDIGAVFNGTQSVTVYINNQSIYEGTLTGPGTVTADFVMPDSEFLNIRLALPDAASPFSLGQSADDSELALVLEQLVLETAE